VPLKRSSRKSAVSGNIRTLMKEGKKQSQAVAIALDVQRRAKKRNAAKGGKKSGGKRKGK
jgi:hypothetical protein